MVLSEIDVFFCAEPSSDVQRVHPEWAFNINCMMLTTRSVTFSSPVPRDVVTPVTLECCSGA